MNCDECREELAAYIEGLLDEACQSRIESHLAECSACEAELNEVRQLTVRLARDGLAAPPGWLEAAVMDRILHQQALELRRLRMRKRIRVFGISGALATALAIFVISSVWFTQSAEAQKAVEAQKAAEVMAKGAEAVRNPSTVHIVAKMRTLPGDNFSYIDANHELVPVEIWKQFGEKPKWRVEKPGRIAVMDGASTMMLIRPNYAVKFPRASESAFDTHWMLGLTNVQNMITRELSVAQAKGWDLKTSDETTAGEKKLLVTVEAKTDVPAGDYSRDKWFNEADMRRVYRFDAKTQWLEGFDAYLHQTGGDVLVWTIEHIEYDQPIDPAAFTLELPENVAWYKEPERLPDNEKYEKMTPKEAAQTFFEACGKEDWDEVQKFFTPIDTRVKEYLGGLKIVSLGEPFQSKKYPGWLIPYEIELKDGNVKKHNLAMRKDNPAKRYVVDGGI